MIKVGNKKQVNHLRDLALVVPGAVLKEKEGMVGVSVENQTILSALKMNGGWSIILKEVTLDGTIYGWDDQSAV